MNAAPKAVSRIDDELLKRTLDDFTALMQAALLSDARSRFTTVGRLATLAESLQGLGGARVEDFDDDMEGMGGVLGAQMIGGLGRIPRRAVAGGDQMEMMRVLIDSITAAMPNPNAPKALAPAAMLNELLAARNSLLLVNPQENVRDLDGRIAALRKELTDVVVPADVLRGHPLEAGERHGDDGLVGKDDGDGARGDGSAVHEGAGQEVDEGDRASR